MAEQYQEGEVLKGSDGKTYIVVGGVPREQVSAPAVESGVYRLPTSPQKAAEEARKVRGAEIAESAEQRAVGGEQRDITKQITDLQKDYRGYDSYKKYTAAVGLYNAGLNTQPNSAGDLELITYAAKMRDPTTGVLGGEEERTQKIETYVNQIKAEVAKQFGWEEGGTLTPEGREFLRTNLRNAFENNFRPLYLQDREYFTQQAIASGIDPVRVVGPDPYDAYKESIEGYWRPKTQPTGIPAAAGGPVVSVTPEESASIFGEFTGGKPAYDAQGNVVGFSYAEAGNPIYDENGNQLDVGLFGRVTEEVRQHPAPSFFGGIAQDVGEAITGSERETATTENLPDWVNMPELNQLLSIPAWKTALGTVFGGGPQEIAQIVQANFPGTKIYQDQKGNYIIESPSTGQRYAIKPGFQLSDVPRLAGTVALGAVGGGAGTVARTAGREAALQAGVEATQLATGGTFNPEDVAAAAALGAVGQKIADIVPPAVQRIRGLRDGGGPTPPTPPAGGAPMAPTGGAPVALGEMRIRRGSEITEGEAPVAPAGITPTQTPTPTGVGGLSAAPTVGAQPLRFDVAPTDILERSTTRAKPGVGVLDDASIADRERVLDALGIPATNRRLGAITGNRPQIEDEVMISKLGEGSERMQQQFDLESRHLGEYALDLVDRTGGTLNLPPVQRGVAIVKPLEDYQNWYNGRIRELYRQADAAAAESGAPITLQDLDDALKVNSTFGGKAALTTLRKGVRQKLQEQNAIDAKGNLLPIDTRTAETIRQYLNDQWSPETSRVIGMLKGKIDDDVLAMLPTDVYAEARQMRRNYANIFEDPKSVAQLLDISGPEGVNRRIALDVVGDKLANLAQKDSAQFNFIVNTLENMPTPELQQAGKQAVAEIRAGILESILKKNVDLEDIAQGGDAMWAGSDKSLSAGLIPFKGKLENIFGPDLAQRLETLRVGARILRFVDPNPSGTATSSQRLVGKTREAMIRSGSAMIGGGIGSMAGPTGAMIGGAAGERAGARIVQSAENRARQAAISRSLDAKEKAAHLAKMRKRQQSGGR